MIHGVLTPCPLMVGLKEHYIGDIATTHPRDLPMYTIGGKGIGCEIRDFCGGRCLYAYLMHPWSEEKRNLLCETVKICMTDFAKVYPMYEDFWIREEFGIPILNIQNSMDAKLPPDSRIWKIPSFICHDLQEIKAALQLHE
jgi:hypothetical protein